MTDNVNKPLNLCHHQISATTFFSSQFIQQCYTAVQRDCSCLTGRRTISPSLKTSMQMWSHHLQEHRRGAVWYFINFDHRKDNAEVKEHIKHKESGILKVMSLRRVGALTKNNHIEDSIDDHAQKWGLSNFLHFPYTHLTINVRNNISWINNFKLLYIFSQQRNS